MPLAFEELDFQPTRMGDLVLRRRTVSMLDDLEVYEVILGDAFLMSSMFTAVEVALADLGLAAVKNDAPLEVVVGGLGLGYTAQAALRDERVGELLVVDALAEVIGWHEKGMVPLGRELTDDSRCLYVHGDFFALAADPAVGFDPEQPGRAFDAVLLDIDHTPSKILDPSHASLYSPEGLRSLAAQIKPGGVFAMWSDDPPEEEFMHSLREVFSEVSSEIVAFWNPLQDKESKSTVYIAKGH